MCETRARARQATPTRVDRAQLRRRLAHRIEPRLVRLVRPGPGAASVALPLSRRDQAPEAARTSDAPHTHTPSVAVEASVQAPDDDDDDAPRRQDRADEEDHDPLGFCFGGLLVDADASGDSEASSKQTADRPPDEHDDYDDN